MLQPFSQRKNLLRAPPLAMVLGLPDDPPRKPYVLGLPCYIAVIVGLIASSCLCMCCVLWRAACSTPERRQRSERALTSIQAGFKPRTSVVGGENPMARRSSPSPMSQARPQTEVMDDTAEPDDPEPGQRYRGSTYSGSGWAEAAFEKTPGRTKRSSTESGRGWDEYYRQTSKEAAGSPMHK